MTLTLQNRWLLVEFIPAPSASVLTPYHGHDTTSTPSPEEISSKDVFNALKQSVLLHFGDVGWGEVGASLAGKPFLNRFFYSSVTTRGLKM